MAYDRQGNWVAEDVQSPYTQRNVQQPGNAGWMVGNNGQTAGINSEGRMSDYDRMALDNGVSSANAESAIAESQYGLNTNRKVERDNDITGSAMRINKGADPAIYGAGGLKGKQVVNTYDPDRPASMGAQGNNPWQDMARQLATFSELRNRPSEQGGVAVMADPADYWNNTLSSMRRDGYYDAPVGLTSQQMAGFIQHRDQTDAQAKTQRRGQDLSFAGQIAGQGVQTRGQDMQYRSHMEGLGLQGRNQRELAGMQGQNQLANTELAYGMQGMNQMAHDMRAGQSARDLEELKQRVQMNDPKNAALAEYYKSGAALHGAQADAARLSQKADPNLAIVQKMMSEGLLDPKNPEHAGIMAGATRALNSHFNGGFESNPQAQMIREAVQAGKMSREEAKAKLAALKGAYADGGQVESPEQVMARIQAKYGVSGTQPQVQAPAPVQQPVRQQAPAPQQPTGGLMDRLRNVATGGLDRRMQGYAEGGPIAVGGRPVVGAGDGKSDSLPAVIDGEHPAALSTGEFVMPIEAVRHFGLDKLNKMVAAARKGLDTGRESE